MKHRLLPLLTWLTVVAAVLSALWLAWRGAASPRGGLAPLVLGRPTPPADLELEAPRPRPATGPTRSAPRPRD